MLDLLSYSDLPIGETRSGPCPSCGKNKFYVTRKPGGYAYICFRASCATQGFYGNSGWQPTKKPYEFLSTPARPVREFTGGLSLPTEADIQYFDRRFGIRLDGVRDASQYIKRTHDGRYAFPIYGVREEERGVAVRRATWKGDPKPPIYDNYGADYPKSLTYWDPDARHCGWYHSTIEHMAIIVEDPVSAMRICDIGYTAICLYGTNFHADVIADILQFKKLEDVIVALDPDAAIKALGIALRWGGSLPRCRTAILQRDPKDYFLDTELLDDLGLL